jgi:hypothetical protein
MLPELKILKDVADNLVIKDFVVPAGEVYKVLWINVHFWANANVGNRRVGVQVLDPTGAVIFQSDAAVVQTANLTCWYDFAPGVPDGPTTINAMMNVPLPAEFKIPSGCTLRVLDTAAISLTDDMYVYGVVERLQL